MGYDLHVTRGDGNAISEAEWRAYVATDPDFELTGGAECETPEGVLRYENPGLSRWLKHPEGDEVWFDLRDGAVVVKNPDEITIAKMLAVARAFGARVEGDDGEIYHTPAGEPRQPHVPLPTRLRAWFARFRPLPKTEPPVLSFGTGQRVRFLGRLGTVAAIDLKANHGMGKIQVRFDDGSELAVMAIAHGLELVD